MVRLGHQVPPYVHGHLSNKNKCDAEPLRLITVLRSPPRLSASKGYVAPSHQDKVTATISLKASPTAPSSLSELLTKRGLLPRTKCRCRSTPSRRVTRRVHGCLPQQDFCSRELSQ